MRAFATASALIFLIACGSSGSNGNGGNGTTTQGIIVTAPDDDGNVIIVGTKDVIDGDGTVSAKNLTSTSSFKVQSSGCSEADESVLSDGSFKALTVCASSGDHIQISHTDSSTTTTVIDNVTVPESTDDSCKTNERPMRVTNSSDDDIWLGITAGTIACQSDSDCPTGASGSCVGANPAASVAGACGCETSDDECGSISTCGDNKKCFWNLPSLGISQLDIRKTKETMICFPEPPSDLSIQWSGNMFARTGCDSKGQNCETGDCGNDADKPCPTGTGGNPPASLYEFTLSNQVNNGDDIPKDFYDISIINGVNLAVEIGPIPNGLDVDSSNPYSCGTAGAKSQSGSLDDCPWSFSQTYAGVDQRIVLRDVKPTSYTGQTCPDGSAPNSLGFCECTAESDCDSSEFCGNALNATSDTSKKYNQVCGTHIGWWTANQICGSTSENPFGAPLNCATTVMNSDGSESTYTNFYLCTKPDGATNPEQAQSCYNNQAVEDCCGCATSASSPLSDAWPTQLSPDFGGSDNGCYDTNPNWETISQPWLVFLKIGCPTAYTYPFDDATSTFTCRRKSSGKPPAYHLIFSSTTD